MRYNVITIEREYASGGREISKILAEKLGYKYYDSEILHMAAQKIGSTVENIGHLDEKVPSSFLYSVYAMSVTGNPSGDDRMPKETKLQAEESRIIKELADKGNCIIIGRCAGAVLKDRLNVLNVFVTSDIETRRKRAIEVYGTEVNQVDSVLKNHDKTRAMYYKYYSGNNWSDKSKFHMILDSGKLGIEKCVDIIMSAIK